jgi:hypothetical protein
LAGRAEPGLRARPAPPAVGISSQPCLCAWKRPSVSASLEYYGAIESINVRPRAQPEVDQLFAGGDWQAAPKLNVNLGVGFDLAGRGPGIVVKSRFEFHWRASHDTP